MRDLRELIREFRSFQTSSTSNLGKLRKQPMLNTAALLRQRGRGREGVRAVTSPQTLGEITTTAATRPTSKPLAVDVLRQSPTQYALDDYEDLLRKVLGNKADEPTGDSAPDYIDSIEVIDEP